MAKASEARNVATRDVKPPASAPQAMKTFREDLGKMQAEFSPMLPAHIPSERFARVVMNAINREPKLLACERRSLWNACMEAAEDGLLPDKKEGAIVPFKDHGTLMATWIPMIGGIRKKVRNSGLLSDFNAQVVYPRDEFDYQLGDDPFIRHKPKPGPRSKDISFVYSIATFKDGTKSRDVMPIEQVLQIARKSKAFEGGPWNDSVFFAEMALKTVAKHHAKQLPTDRDLDRVMRRDDALYDFEGKKPGLDHNERQTIKGGTSAALQFFAEGAGAAGGAEAEPVVEESQAAQGSAGGAGDAGEGTVEDKIERAAADLWREENPTQSVFDCAADVKERYRERARAIARGEPDPKAPLPTTPDEYAAFFRAWLPKVSDADAAGKRWKAEQDVRLDLKPEIPVELLRVLKAELDARIAELRQ